MPDPTDRALHPAPVDDTKAWQENNRDSSKARDYEAEAEA